MKFLVIGTPNGRDHGITMDQARAHLKKNAAAVSKNGPSLSAKLKSMLDPSTRVEKSYALISGGFAIVINATDTYELAEIVRGNPLFHYSHVQIIPIADAYDFLAHSAKIISGKKPASSTAKK